MPHIDYICISVIRRLIYTFVDLNFILGRCATRCNDILLKILVRIAISTSKLETAWKMPVIKASKMTVRQTMYLLLSRVPLRYHQVSALHTQAAVARTLGTCVWVHLHLCSGCAISAKQQVEFLC